MSFLKAKNGTVTGLLSDRTYKLHYFPWIHFCLLWSKNIFLFLSTEEEKSNNSSYSLEPVPKTNCDKDDARAFRPMKAVLWCDLQRRWLFKNASSDYTVSPHQKREMDYTVKQGLRTSITHLLFNPCLLRAWREQ